MSDRRTYLIRLEGQADEGEINATSPVRVEVVRAGEEGTVLRACADQSGLVGPIRHLHGVGFAIEGVGRESGTGTPFSLRSG